MSVQATVQTKTPKPTVISVARGLLQRAAINSSPVGEVPPIVHEILRSPGQLLDAQTRAFMEPRFGHNFSQVRMHTDARAAESAHAVNALAYTLGKNVVFGAGQYVQEKVSGKQLLAHELTHVVQQSGSAYNGQPMMRMEGSTEDRLEKDADIQAKRVIQGQTIPGDSTQNRFDKPVLQRQADITKAPSSLSCILVSGAGHPLGLNYLFAQSKAELSPEGKADIAQLVHLDFVKDGIPDKIVVHGFASVEGTQTFNWQISCTRAEAIKAELVRNGIPANKVTTIAHGKSTEFSATNLSENRRAIIDFVDSSKLVVVPSAPTPTLPAPDTEDCKPSQTTMLKNHMKNARLWVDYAERKIAEYANAYASTRVESVMRSANEARIVRSALLDNFHTVEPNDVREIAENLASLRTELNNDFTFECASTFWCSTNELAYVRGGIAFVRRLFDINVCPGWFSCGNYFTRVSTLIHERAHQYPGATDNAYEWQASYASLSASDAIDNADSYAVAVRQIYHGGKHSPGESC